MSHSFDLQGTARCIRRSDDEWPVGLTELGPHRMPERLFVAGSRLPDIRKSIAIVGTRRPTAAGLEITTSMASAFAEAGFTVISGLAMGIDAVAHRETLRSGGATVAVLGCGLDVDYPLRNRRLKTEIRHRGSLVTEYEPGTPPLAHHFPERNRIVAGLVSGVVVVEGGERSGALITARRALDANRAIWAVPGSVRNPMAAGPNSLIRSGEATLVTSPQDVFDELAPGLIWDQLVDRLAPSRASLGEDESTVIRLLDDAPLASERVCTDLQWPAGRVAMALSRLEVRGLATRRRTGYELSQAGARLRDRLEAE